MNWQKLGPMIHAAAREHLKSPTEDTRSRLATFVKMGNFAGNHTEWDGSISGHFADVVIGDGLPPFPPDVVERVALALYNLYRERCKMRPVDYIGANNTPECNQCREDARAALAARVIGDEIPPFPPDGMRDK